MNAMQKKILTSRPGSNIGVKEKDIRTQKHHLLSEARTKQVNMPKALWKEMNLDASMTANSDARVRWLQLLSF